MSSQTRIVRKTWSEKEKNILRELYGNQGENCFELISKYIPGRQPKDARQVWKYHMNDKFKKSPFTHEEQEKIKYFRETEKMGWSEMEKHFLERDQIRLKNEYRKIKRNEKLPQVFPKPSGGGTNEEHHLFDFPSLEQIMDHKMLPPLVVEEWDL